MRKRILKKIVSGALVVSMLFSNASAYISPIRVLASDNDDSYTEEPVVIEEQDVDIVQASSEAFTIGDANGDYTSGHEFVYNTELIFKMDGEKIDSNIFYSVNSDESNPQEFHSDNLLPGTYYFLAFDMNSQQHSFTVNIVKDDLGKATNLGWVISDGIQTGKVSFDVPTVTKSGLTIDEGAIKGYQVSLYKNDKKLVGDDKSVFISTSDATTITHDFESVIASEGYGNYSFTVDAIVSDSKANCYNNSGEFAVDDKYLPVDTIAPVIKLDSFVIEEQSGNYSFKAEANDKESGIYGYAFSTDVSKNLDDTDWETPTGTDNIDAPLPDEGDPAVPQYHTYGKSISNPGEYYFFVKDKDNVVCSEKLYVAKLTLKDYYNGAASTKTDKVMYVNTNSSYTLPTPSRNGYVFKGWYDGDEKVSSLDAQFVDYKELTAHWEKTGISVNVAADSDHGAMTSVSGIEYTGSGKLIADVTTDDTNREVPLSYQWFKEQSDGDNTSFVAISGATSTELSVKNVTDSGKYKLHVIFDQEAGEEGFIDSAEVSVTINKKQLTLTPKYTQIVDASEVPIPVYYGDAAPTDFNYSITGFVDGESIDNVSITKGTINTTYTRGNDAGTYKISASGFDAENYSFEYVDGSLVVSPKKISDADVKSVSVSFEQEVGQDTDTYKYTGSAVTPAVTVVDSSFDEESESANYAVSNTNYTVDYSNNVLAGTATATLNFSGNYSGSLTKTFEIKKAPYEASVSFDNDLFGTTETKSFMYDGEEHKPAYSISNNPENGKVTYYFARVTSTEGGDVVGDYSTDYPKNAGKYKVYAVIAATANYESVTTAASDFEITKRPITIQSEDGKWVYDGNLHTKKDILDTKITGEEPLFAHGEDFQYIFADGEIVDKGTKENKIEYAFASGTDENNYDVTLIPGTLEITEQKLTTASNQKWDMDHPGTVSWVAVSKDNVDIKYELQLYRVTSAVGTEKYVKVGDPVTTNSTTYNFRNEIHEDLNTYDVPANGYVFTLKSIPTDGTKKDNYTESDPTELSDSLSTIYATKVKIDVPDESSPISDAYFDYVDSNGTYITNTKAYQYFIQGEDFQLRAIAKPGYDANGFMSKEDNTYDCGLDGYYYPSDNSLYSFAVTTLKKPSADITLVPHGSDIEPRVLSLKADVTNPVNANSEKQKVVLEYSAEDILGLKCFVITKGEHNKDYSVNKITLSEGENQTITVDDIKYTYSYVKDGNVWKLSGTAEVTTDGAYNIGVWDTSNNWSRNYVVEQRTKTITEKNEAGEDVPKTVVYQEEVFNPVMVYKVTFDSGKAGENSATNNGFVSYVLKLKDQDITLPDRSAIGTDNVKPKLYANGYSFTNFKGTDGGLYPNKGTYTANKNDTLTALWSDERYTYKVHYFYQGIGADGKAEKEADGITNKFVEDTSATASFTAGYNEEIKPSLAKLQKPRVGFVRDASKDVENTFNIIDNTHEINIYYKRAPYTITYKYTDIDGNEKIDHQETYYYGESVTEKTTKPSVDGYTFIGWTYGDSGKTPVTMPENSIVAKGHFEANATSYIIDYYYENLNGDGYSLDHSETRYTFPTSIVDGSESGYVSATHNSEITLSNMIVPTVEGFTYKTTGATNGAASTTPPEEPKTTATVNALEGNTLHIAYYYTRNTYTITLNVYKGGRTDGPIYNHVFNDIKYQTPFVTPNTAEYYAEYDKDNWTSGQTEESMKGYELSSIIDWSTGEAPSLMPSGNIVVNRDYISTTQCPYDINIYYENVPGQYEHFTTLTQYKNEGKEVKIAKTSDDSEVITEKRFQQIYSTLSYYELDETKITSENSTGIVVNPEKHDDKRLVLEVYFKRPICHTTIEYRYFDPKLNQTIVIGKLEKSGKWYTTYDPEVGIFYGTGGASTDIKNSTSDDPESIWKYTPAKISKDPNPDGKYTTRFDIPDNNEKYVPITVDEKGNILTKGEGTPIHSFDFDSAHIITVSYNSRYLKTDGNYTWPTGTVNPDGTYVDSKAPDTKYGAENDTIKNYCYVTYVHQDEGGSGLGHYYIDIKYRTNELQRYATDMVGGNVEKPLTVNINGTVYKVRVANACDLYKDCDADLKGKNNYSNKELNAGLEKYTYTNPTTNKSVEVFLAPSAGEYKLGDLDSSNFEDNYLYIADYDNPILWGHYFNKGYWSTYRDVFDDDAKKALTEYKTKEEQLKQENNGDIEEYDRNYTDAEFYSYTNSYIAVITGSFDQTIYFHYQDPTYLNYNLYGNVYQRYYSKGTQTHISTDVEDAAFISHFSDSAQEGSSIVWYKDSNYTEPATDFVITDTTALYGRYEKDTYPGWHNVYYELANPVTIGEVDYTYLNKAQLDALIDAESYKAEADKQYRCVETDETIYYDSEFRNVDNTPIQKSFASKKYVYTHNGEPVLIARTVPELSSTEVMTLDYKDSMYTEGFHGFEYDGTAENKVRAYCQYEAVDLQAYYKRITYPLTFDFNDKDAFGNKKTDDVTIDAPYNAEFEGENGIDPDATRTGYDFAGWTYYKKDATDGLVEIEPQPTNMPNYEVVAVAEWEPTTFDYELFHYFQKNDQTYETDLVKAIDAKYSVASPILTKKAAKLILNGSDSGLTVDVIKVNGRDYGVLKLSDKEFAYLSGTYENSVFSATYSDLIGIKTIIKKTDSSAMKSEDTYNCNQYAYSVSETFGNRIDISMFGYDFTVHRIGGDINNLHIIEGVPDQYKADVEMDLAIYYKRTAGSVIKVYTRIVDDGYATTVTNSSAKPTGLTVTGEGSYNYGAGANLAVEVAAGYSFLGWYTEEEYNAKFANKDFVTGATKYAEASYTNLTVPTVSSLTLVAVSEPKTTKEPSVYINNEKLTYTYGYADSSSNILSMKVDLTKDSEGNVITDSSVYHVKSYQWFSCDENGEKIKEIEGATATTFNIPTGLDAGKYYYGCEIEVERLDNGRSIKVVAYTREDDDEPVTDEETGEITYNGNRYNNPITVVRSDILVTEGSYNGVYDGKGHSAAITISGVGSPKYMNVYFATEELTKDNYLLKGKQYNGHGLNTNNDDSIISTVDEGSTNTADILYSEVATTLDDDNNKIQKLTSDGKPAPQYIYYYIADDSENHDEPVNFNNKAGKIAITISPKPVVIKALNTTFKKVYDGTKELSSADKERFRNPGDYFTIDGLLPEHKEKLTAVFIGEYNAAHVNSANSIKVTVTGIETTTNPEANYNYVVTSGTAKVDFTGQIVPRPIDINWYKAESDKVTSITVDGESKYFSYQYDGKNKAPYPEIHDSTEPERGVLAKDKGHVTVVASGKQKNCGSYTAHGEVQVTDSPLNSVSGDYAVSDDQLKCSYKIVNNDAHLELVAETVTYDKVSHSLSRLTPETLALLGVISVDTEDKTEEQIAAALKTEAENVTLTVDDSTGVITITPSKSECNKVSYSVNKKYVNAGVYTDIQVVQGTVKVMSNENKNITGNFSFSYPNATLTIEQKSVTVTGITASDKVYDGNVIASLDVSSVAFEGICAGDSLSLDASKVTGTFRNADNNADDKDAGNGKPVAIVISSDALSGTSKDNYVLDVESSQKDVTATISKKTLTVSPTGFDGIDYTYGDTLPAVFTATSGEESTSGSDSKYLSITGFVDGETRSVISGNVTFEGYAQYDDVGNKTISLKTSKTLDVDYVDGLTATNYVFVPGTTSTFTVKKRPLTVSSSQSKTKVYDGTTATAGTEAEVKPSDFTLTNIVNEDDVSIASGFTALYDSKNADSSGYHSDKATKITVSNLSLTGDKAGNYDLGENASCDITASITKAELTITANDITDVVYGDNPFTATTGKKCDVTYSGFVTVDGVEETSSELDGTLSFKSVSGTNLEFNVSVPSKRGVTAADKYYDITPYGVTADNYNITFASGEFNVVKKLIVIKAGDSPVAYMMFTKDQLKEGYSTSIKPDNSWAYNEGSYSSGKADKTNEEYVLEESKKICYCEVEDAITSPANDDGYVISIGKTDDERNALINDLEFKYANYEFEFENGKLVIGRQLLVIDASALAIDSKVYDTTTTVLPEQIKLADGKSLNDLFRTVKNNNDSPLDDISNIKAAYTTWLGDPSNADKTLVDFLETQGLKITGVYTDNKDVDTDKPVKLTCELVTSGDKSYLGLRYCFDNANGTESFTKDYVSKTADIIKKDLELKAEPCTVAYGSELPTPYTNSMLIVNPDNNDRGFAGSEGFDDLGGSLTLETNYKSSNTATLAGETGIYRVPSGYTSNNYNIINTQGGVTVIQAKLDAPKDVLWSSTTPGTLNWSEVSGIGDVEVGCYKLELYKTVQSGGSSTTTQIDISGDNVTEKVLTLNKDVTSYNFYNDIKSDLSDGEIALITVKIWAEPSSTKNDAASGAKNANGDDVSTNVAKSDEVDTNTIETKGSKLAVAKITPEFATDADTTNGKGTISIKKSGDAGAGSDSVILVAGETAEIIVVPKENKTVDGSSVTVWTGYTVADSNVVKNTANNEEDGDWSVSGGTQYATNSGKGKFVTTFKLELGCEKTELKPVISLTPRTATLTLSQETKDATAVPDDEHLKVKYMFTESAAPKTTITVNVLEDNVTKDDYDYSYSWELLFNTIKREPATTLGTSNENKLPNLIKSNAKSINLPAGSSYYLKCTVTATRKDNGKQISKTIMSHPMIVLKAKANVATAMTGWTYGEQRNNPGLNTTYEHPDGLVPSYYYSADVDKADDESTWTKEEPFVNAGTYKVRAHYDASYNVDVYDAPSAPYTISKAKLEKPTADDSTNGYGWAASSSAPYGKAVWKASPVIKENADNDGVSDATVTPEYTVKLYKNGDDESNVVETKTGLTTTEYDFLTKINECGPGTYHFTVEAIPNDDKGKSNCDNSDIARSNEIIVKKLGSSEGNNIFTKTYDGTYESEYSEGSTTQGITLLAEQNEDSYEWYVNGSKVESTKYYVPVFDYKATPDNYSCISTKSGTKTFYINEKVTINKRTVTFVADSDEKVYDQKELTKNSYAVKSGTSLADGDTVNTFVITGSQINAGESNNVPSDFTVNRTVGGSSVDETGNYNISYENGKLKVTPRSLASTHDASASDFEIADVYTSNAVVYDGISKTPEPSLVDTKLATGTNYTLVKGSDFDYSYSTDTTNVGTVTITMTGKGNYKDSITKTFEITKRPVTFEGKSDTKIYTGSEIQLTDVSSSTGTDEGLVLDHNYSVSYSAKGTEVGTYAGTITPAASVVIKDASGNVVTNNYAITTTAGTLTISQTSEEFSVALENDTYKYDGSEKSSTKSPTSTATTGVTTYKYSFVEDGTYVSDLSTLKKTDAGEYTIYVKASNPNYSNEAKTTGKLIIKKRNVIITSATDSREYNGSPFTRNTSSDITVTDDGFIPNEGASYNITGSQTLVGSSVNSFTYTLNSNTKESNYSISKSEGTLTVTNRTNKYPITVESNSDNATYNGTNVSATGFVTTSFTVDGNTYTVEGLTATTGEQKDAGTYPNVISGTAVVKDVDGNDVTDQFTVNKTEGILTISKSKVTIKSKSATKEYDGTALTNEDYEIVDGSFVAGEGVVLTYTGTQTLPGQSNNTYLVEAATGTSLLNYDIDQKYGTLEVQNRTIPFNISVTAKSDIAIFDRTVKNVSGFEKIDDEDASPSPVAVNTSLEPLKFTKNGKTFTITGLSASVNGTSAGAYSSVVAGNAIVTDSDNNDVTAQFNIIKNNGTLTILPTTNVLPVTAVGFEGLKDGNAHSITVTVNQADEAVVYYSTSEVSAADFKSLVDAGTISSDSRFQTANLTYTEINNTINSGNGQKVYYYVASSNYSDVFVGSEYVLIKPHEYTVQYDANLEETGITVSNVPSNMTKIEDINISLSINILSAKDSDNIDRYIFKGWNTKADGTGLFYAAGANFDQNGDLTLYGVWEEKVEGTITFEYEYIDPVDNVDKVTDQRMEHVILKLVRQIDGELEVIDSQIVSIPMPGADNTATASYEFKTQDSKDYPTYVNGKKAEYIVVMEPGDGKDFANYARTTYGYKGRNFHADYTPNEFILPWLITVDESLKGSGYIPSSVNVKVLYRETEDDSWHIITQHALSSVECVNEQDMFTGDYPLWKWNSSLSRSYEHNFMIDTITIDGKTYRFDEVPQLEFITFYDEGIEPVYFEPDDPVNAPNGTGVERGGKNDAGIMTGYLRLKQYTVSYDANGGLNAPKEAIKEYGKDYIVSTVIPSNEGYTFEGWSTKPNGSVEYKPGDSFEGNEDVVFYAIWKKIPVIEPEKPVPTPPDVKKPTPTKPNSVIPLGPTKPIEPTVIEPSDKPGSNTTKDERLEVTEKVKDRKDEKLKIVSDDLSETEKIGKIFDVNKYIIENGQEKLLEGDSSLVEVKVAIPKDLLNVPEGTERHFRIIRIYEDENGNLIKEPVDAIVVNGEVVFNADTESTYVLIYDDTVPLFADSEQDECEVCYWHWLILLTAFLYMVVLLITMKKKKLEDEFGEGFAVENLDEQQLKKLKSILKRSRNYRLVASALYALILYIITVLGFCNLEILFDIITGIIVGGAEYGTYKYKFKDFNKALEQK